MINGVILSEEYRIITIAGHSWEDNYLYFS